MTGDLRGLLQTERNGLLATLSARRGGWPFASVAPYALTDACEPILLLSDLAEHTRNVRADPRASLLVLDRASSEDPQAGSRVTLLGRVEQVTDAQMTTARARYLERHPQSAGYVEMTDFRFYVLRVTEARFIGGFGDMGWIEGERLQAALRR